MKPKHTEEFLKDRIVYLEELIHKLEVVATNFYSVFDEDGDQDKGWNILLKSRDQVQKLLNDDYEELYSYEDKEEKK